MSKHSLAQYYAAVSAALRAEDVEDVPGLLVLMAADGYGHEAEELRRQMVLVSAVSEHLTREELVVAATKAALGAQPNIPASMHEYSLIVDAALPVIVKAITDRVRALHEPIEMLHMRTNRIVTVCLACGTDAGERLHPCPTVRLLDEIDTEIGVQ